MARAWRFGDNIDTDLIIAARYLNTSDLSELSKHIMEDADADFVKKATAGDFIVAGENFGCGSSREHAPAAIKAFGIKGVVGKSFARIFYRNAFNTGLLIYETKEAGRIENGDDIEIDSKSGEIVNKTKNQRYRYEPIPEFMQAIADAGGLMKYAAEEIKNGAK
ncbi:MAG: 3-isopropylmalate dehydratase small subunit [Helicobacteraceae bacterium]|jgi:3-isopropylmalate/(R)-2-methylmalate dehydratase small subunit|nr:3-isopropylmalate dehydratase small subunit [Helicobacteraceae bacterium]